MPSYQIFVEGRGITFRSGDYHEARDAFSRLVAESTASSGRSVVLTCDGRVAERFDPKPQRPRSGGILASLRSRISRRGR